MSLLLAHVMFCAIWYRLYSFKKREKTPNGGVLLLVVLQVETCKFTKSNTLRGCFSRFLKWTNDTKSPKASTYF